MLTFPMGNLDRDTGSCSAKNVAYHSFASDLGRRVLWPGSARRKFLPFLTLGARVPLFLLHP